MAEYISFNFRFVVIGSFKLLLFSICIVWSVEAFQLFSLDTSRSANAVCCVALCECCMIYLAKKPFHLHGRVRTSDFTRYFYRVFSAQ